MDTDPIQCLAFYVSLVYGNAFERRTLSSAQEFCMTVILPVLTHSDICRAKAGESVDGVMSL